MQPTLQRDENIRNDTTITMFYVGTYVIALLLFYSRAEKSFL